MTKQAKSDEELMCLFNTNEITPVIIQIRAYRQAESELLPIINQQAEEIETLRGIIQRAKKELESSETPFYNGMKILSEVGEQ